MARIFLAHPHEYSDIDALVAKLRHVLPPQAQSTEIVSGVADYERNFARFVNWDGWIYSVALGIEYQGGLQAQRFTSIVVAPAVHIGKATRGIVAQALGRKPIYYFDGEAKLARVLGINVVDDTDYKNGWELILPMEPGAW